ncbi:MAG TPA: hypothetical protein VGE66_16550 [Chitinophagaceae bacterium]
MKRLFISFLILATVTACGNDAGNKDSVGDSLEVDPTTAQPITTEPDTVGPQSTDTTNQENSGLDD